MTFWRYESITIRLRPIRAKIAKIREMDGMQSKILVIDDQQSCLDSMKRVLRYAGREVDYFQDPEDAMAIFKQSPFSYSLAFVDHMFDEGDEVKKRGGEIAERLKNLNPMMTVCIVSGDSSEEAVKGWLSSAVDQYRYKPIKRQEILVFTEHYVREYEESFMPIEHQNESYSRPTSANKLHKEMVGVSSALEECCYKALRFAPSDVNVLLLGEMGTGKELLAKGIHRKSENKKYGFHSFNCLSGQENNRSVEVELFGCVEGAFPGAKDWVGILEMAGWGTVFLDEVQNLSASAQKRLLRVLETRKVTRLGDMRSRPVPFRLVSAAKSNLSELCKAGQFSLELYYRLKGIDLLLPPLRERKEDIAILATYFLKKFAKGNVGVKKISRQTLRCLEKYDWPGNIRELEQLIKQLCLGIDDAIIMPKHLPRAMRYKKEIQAGSLNLIDLEEGYKASQKAFILKALEESGNNLTVATKRLGLGNKKSTLRSKMKQLQIGKLSSLDRQGLLYKFQNLFQLEEV